MQLFYRERGRGNRTLIIVHGLYGASDNWLPTARALEDSFRIILVDQRNHGRSPHSSQHTYQDMADDLFELMNHLSIERAVLLGHSMGGKTVMRFALQHPEMVEQLIVVDIAPKSYDHISNNKQITIGHMEILQTLSGLHLSDFHNRHEIDEALARSIPEKNLRAFLTKNIKRQSDGSYHWIINFEAIKNNLGEIMKGFPLQNTAKDRTISLPETIFIKGEKSPYIQDEDSTEIHRYFPGAHIVTVPGANHWVHSEQHTLFVKTLKYFMGV